MLALYRGTVSDPGPDRPMFVGMYDSQAVASSSCKNISAILMACYRKDVLNHTREGVSEDIQCQTEIYT